MKRWINHKLDSLARMHIGDADRAQPDDTSVRNFIDCLTDSDTPDSLARRQDCLLVWRANSKSLYKRLEQLQTNQEAGRVLTLSEVVTREFLNFMQSGYPIEVSHEAFVYGAVIMGVEAPANHADHLDRTAKPSAADSLSGEQLDAITEAICTISYLIDQDNPRSERDLLAG